MARTCAVTWNLGTVESWKGCAADAQQHKIKNQGAAGKPTQPLSPPEVKTVYLSHRLGFLAWHPYLHPANICFLYASVSKAYIGFAATRPARSL